MVCIDRCVCFGRTFAELKRIAEAHGVTTLEDLQDHTDFGIACRMCNPYVDRMLETGETTFSEIIPLDLLRRSQAKRKP